MGYETKLAKSFSHAEPKKLGFAAVLSCFLISFLLFSVFERYVDHQSILKLWTPTPPEIAEVAADEAIIPQKPVEMTNQTNAASKKKKKKLCDISDHRIDICEIEGDVRIDGRSSSVFQLTSFSNETWRIRPYARKGDSFAMINVKELVVRSSPTEEQLPRCNVNHTVPAIVFSAGGYTGNIFHDFSDVIIPLFLTSRRFSRKVQFLVTDMNMWWMRKYNLILNALSRYEIIDLQNDNRTHCFKRATVGLWCHKDLTIMPSKPPFGYSMLDFTKLMRSVFLLERQIVVRIDKNVIKKPRLLIISRNRTRTFKNLNEIARMANETGYEVVIAEANVSSDVAQFAKIVNSCDVLMGVHGAGLANLIFLPANAVLIQIVPWGGLEWVARYDYGEPAVDMKLKYLEYKIKEEESTLMEQYPRDHPVFRDPFSIHKKGWLAMREVFLDKQDVRIDVFRLRPLLLEAQELLHQ